MHLSTRITAKVTGVPRGGRTEKAFYTRVRAEVEVPDISPADLRTVATVSAPHGMTMVFRALRDEYQPIRPLDQAERRPFNLTYYTLEAGGLFDRISFPPEGTERDAWIGHVLLDLPYGTERPSDTLAPMRSVTSDDGAAMLARAAAAASRTGHLEGLGFLVPARPMQIVVELNTDESYHCFGMKYVGERDDGSMDCFGLEEFEEAIAFARERGATEADIAAIRANLVVDVKLPHRTGFDSVLWRGVAAINALYRDCRKTLHNLPLEKIVAWTKMRDAWDTYHRGETPIDRVLVRARLVADLMLHDGYLSAREKRQIPECLAAMEAHLSRHRVSEGDAAALDALTSAP